MAATPLGISWGNWTTDGTISGSTLAASSNTTSGAISNNVATPGQVVVTECNLVFTYGASTVTACTISIFEQTQAGYQVIGDGPYGFTFPATPVASTTFNCKFRVPADEVANFKVNVASGANTNSITAMTLYYRQGTIEIGS